MLSILQIPGVGQQWQIYPTLGFDQQHPKKATKPSAEAHWAHLQGLLSHSVCARDGERRDGDKVLQSSSGLRCSLKIWQQNHPRRLHPRCVQAEEAGEAKLSCSANCLSSCSTLRGISTSENTGPVGSLCKDPKPKVSPISSATRGITGSALLDSGPVCVHQSHSPPCRDVGAQLCSKALTHKYQPSLKLSFQPAQVLHYKVN